MIELSTHFSMECAHFLPHVPEGHKCGRMHGHSYRCTLAMTGVIDPYRGWFTDSGDVQNAAKMLVQSRLDHRCLNEIRGLENPTAENLTQWIWAELHPALRDLGAELIAVTIHETDGTNVTYRIPPSAAARGSDEE